jgi:hypothetical protein
MVDLNSVSWNPSTDMAVPARRGVNARCAFKCDITGARDSIPAQSSAWPAAILCPSRLAKGGACDFVYSAQPLRRLL